MSFTFEQKVGKHTYVYEVTNSWDKERKKYTQQRTILGKIDPKTKKMIPTRKKPERLPRSVLNFGATYFIQELLKQLHLSTILKQSFPEQYKDIISLIIFKASLENKAMYLFEDWQLENLIEPSNLTTQRISELLVQIGQNASAMEQFTKLWVQKHSGRNSSIMFDITSISSHSENLELVEYGYNRNHDNLEQINLGVIFNQQNSLPLTYQIYPGSIPDVVTLQNIIKLIGKYRLEVSSFVLDRGFYSSSNIADLAENKLNFIVPMKTEIKIAKEIIDNNLDITMPDNSFIYNSNHYYHKMLKVKISTTNVFAHLFYDEQRKAAEISSLMKRLTEIKEKFVSKKITSIKEAKLFLEELPNNLQRFFKLNSSCQLQFDNKAILDAQNYMGKFILLTNIKEISTNDILALYRQKDQVEKVFLSLKNDLQEERLRVRNDDALKGRIFILFLTLIVLAKIRKLAKTTKLSEKFTLNQILLNLKKLKLYKLSDNSCLLGELTKVQKNIFKAADVKIPSAYGYNLTGI